MRIGLLLIALFGLVGCAADPPPQPDVTRTVSPRPSYQPPPSLPPPVQRPLDASGYRTRICEIVTNDQAQALGIPGVPDQSEAPQFISCVRESKDPAVDLGILYAGSELFRKAYLKNKSPLDYSKLVTIAGQPALEIGTPVLGGSVPYCQIVLGLASDQAIQIDMNLHIGGSGACERATKVAEAIVHNLGG